MSRQSCGENIVYYGLKDCIFMKIDVLRITGSKKKNLIPELSELSIAPTSPQFWITYKIEDYQL